MCSDELINFQVIFTDFFQIPNTAKGWNGPGGIQIIESLIWKIACEDIYIFCLFSYMKNNLPFSREKTLPLP